MNELEKLHKEKAKLYREQVRILQLLSEVEELISKEHSQK